MIQVLRLKYHSPNRNLKIVKKNNRVFKCRIYHNHFFLLKNNNTRILITIHEINTIG